MENSNDLGPTIYDEPPAPETQPVLMVVSEGVVVLLDEATGEVVGMPDAPPADTLEVRELVKWLAPRRVNAQAKAAGLRAEKAFKAAKLDAEYDWQIKRADSTVTWLDTTYFSTLRDFTARALAGGKARSLKLGEIVLAFRNKPGKLEITDEQAARDYLTVICPAALQTKTSVMVSRVPAELRADLPAYSGLIMTAPSEVFEVK